MTILKDMNELNWYEVCNLDEITPNTGVAALIEDQQIAIFRVGQERGCMHSAIRIRLVWPMSWHVAFWVICKVSV